MTDDNVLRLPLAAGIAVPDRQDRDWVTSQELMAESGISFRQLDYWTRTGFLHHLDAHDPGSGYRRCYPVDQISRARTAHDLLAAGVSLQVVRAVIDEVLTTGHYEIGPVRVTVHHQPQETA